MLAPSATALPASPVAGWQAGSSISLAYESIRMTEGLAERMAAVNIWPEKRADDVQQPCKKRSHIGLPVSLLTAPPLRRSDVTFYGYVSSRALSPDRTSAAVATTLEQKGRVVVVLIMSGQIGSIMLCPAADCIKPSIYSPTATPRIASSSLGTGFSLTPLPHSQPSHLLALSDHPLVCLRVWGERKAVKISLTD